MDYPIIGPLVGSGSWVVVGSGSWVVGSDSWVVVSSVGPVVVGGSVVGGSVEGVSVVVGSVGFPKQVHFLFTKHAPGPSISSSLL